MEHQDYDDLLELTRWVAVQRHGDQKYGDKPYVEHLDLVVKVLRKYEYNSDEQLQVGYLHDVLEDTPTTRNDLRAEGFSEIVVDAVAFCTDQPGHNRKTRKAATYSHMSKCREDYLAGEYPCFLLGMRAKVADRLANVIMARINAPSLFDMYQKEHATFRAALYLPGTADAMWVKLDYLLRP